MSHFGVHINWRIIFIHLILIEQAGKKKQSVMLFVADKYIVVDDVTIRRTKYVGDTSWYVCFFTVKKCFILKLLMSLLTIFYLIS